MRSQIVFITGAIKMAAIEFQTVANDGIIYIPDIYHDKLWGKVKVIIMTDESDFKETLFPYFSVDTTGYVFNRDEANAR